MGLNDEEESDLREREENETNLIGFKTYKVYQKISQRSHMIFNKLTP